MHVGCALDSVHTINTFYTKGTSIHCSTIDYASSVVSIIMMNIDDYGMNGKMEYKFVACGHDFFSRST